MLPKQVLITLYIIYYKYYNQYTSESKIINLKKVIIYLTKNLYNAV